MITIVYLLFGSAVLSGLFVVAYKSFPFYSSWKSTKQNIPKTKNVALSSITSDDIRVLLPTENSVSGAESNETKPFLLPVKLKKIEKPLIPVKPSQLLKTAPSSQPTKKIIPTRRAPMPPPPPPPSNKTKVQHMIEKLNQVQSQSNSAFVVNENSD